MKRDSELKVNPFNRFHFFRFVWNDYSTVQHNGIVCSGVKNRASDFAPHTVQLTRCSNYETNSNLKITKERKKERKKERERKEEKVKDGLFTNQFYSALIPNVYLSSFIVPYCFVMVCNLMWMIIIQNALTTVKTRRKTARPW